MKQNKSTEIEIIDSSQPDYLTLLLARDEEIKDFVKHFPNIIRNLISGIYKPSNVFTSVDPDLNKNTLIKFNPYVINIQPIYV